jgi:integrase
MLVHSKFPLITRNQSDAFRLLFLLPQRVGELLGMRWEDIDFDEKVWNMSQNKSDRAFSVPLSTQALKVLEDRKNGVGYTEKLMWMVNSPWVFPSKHNRFRDHSKNTGHTTSLRKSMLIFHREVDMPHWRIHDIRRSVRTLLAEIGTDENISELILNHSVKGLVGVYNRYNFLEEKRTALQKWADELEVIVNG